MFQINWGAVVTQLLAVLLPILAVALITWLAGLATKVWASVKQYYPKWAQVIQEYTPVAVAAAEQLRKSGVLPDGKAALAYAVTAVQTYLNAHGLKSIDVSLIETAVEAAVKNLPPTTPVDPVANIPAAIADAVGKSL
jgi:hypothetical protein